MGFRVYGLPLHLPLKVDLPLMPRYVKPSALRLESETLNPEALNPAPYALKPQTLPLAGKWPGRTDSGTSMTSFELQKRQGRFLKTRGTAMTLFR